MGAASRRDYAQDVRYIAKSTRMCGAILSGLYKVKKIAAGTPLLQTMNGIVPFTDFSVLP